MSYVTCHVSHVMCNFFLLFSFLCSDKVVELVNDGSVIIRAYPVQFKMHICSSSDPHFLNISCQRKGVCNYHFKLKSRYLIRINTGFVIKIFVFNGISVLLLTLSIKNIFSNKMFHVKTISVKDVVSLQKHLTLSDNAISSKRYLWYLCRKRERYLKQPWSCVRPSVNKISRHYQGYYWIK